MTAFLPSNLLALFAARPPIPYLPPLDKLGHQKKPWPYSGIASIVADFEDPEDTPSPTRAETRDEKIERKKCERIKKKKADLEKAAEEWDPHTDGSDAFKTLFVGRLNYDTSEKKMRREMEVYGPVKSIQMVTNSTTGKPRGYCFVEFEHERDMHTAYKHADGKKIDGRRIVVDVERGRTVKNWKPRRLGIAREMNVIVVVNIVTVQGVIVNETVAVIEITIDMIVAEKGGRVFIFNSIFGKETRQFFI
ncbi:U1 small nuclear ribonucleoprotein 70 kDa-like isoform X4 [Xenia sp. Carnegie-2017]|uniref:U1 small nuclear ribonucleoprotein 70 kDa-like isoform X4 n=1 Tax=Xenia sp. Carnegie-2017 TaxID=2897299 RepID=UPI001F04ADA3|nr:U1 small nuclear ribonucleoprotein 70 kDa-like isoform X4 [Xenia sp. Carnegie-2017]